MSETGAAPPAGPHGPSAPSEWVRRFASLAVPGGAVLDLAAGAGRHARLFLDRGHPVTAVDIDTAALAPLAGRPGLEIVAADLEAGTGWPLEGRRFATVVVVNYLWRPLFPRLIEALVPGGALIYETFARGNERFGKPRRKDHLLGSGELLEAVRGHLRVVAYEHGLVRRPRPAVVQRLAAVRATGADAVPAPLDPD